MGGSITLSAQQRKSLLNMLRSAADVRVSRRAHVVLLLADGYSHLDVRAGAYVSFDFIVDCARRFRNGGADSLADAFQSPDPAWLEYLLECGITMEQSREPASSPWQAPQGFWDEGDPQPNLLRPHRAAARTPENHTSSVSERDRVLVFSDGVELNSGKVDSLGQLFRSRARRSR